MIRTMDEILDEVAGNPIDRFTLKEWKEIFLSEGLRITADDSGKPEDEVIPAGEIKAFLQEECIYETFDPEKVEPEVVETQADRDLFNAARIKTGLQPLPVIEPSEPPVQAEDRTAREPVAVEIKPVDINAVTEKIEAKKLVPAPAAMKGPTIVPPPPKKKIPVDEWRKMFNDFRQKVPTDAFIRSQDETPIRVDIMFQANKPPFMFTKIYLSNIVGAQIEWYGQRENDFNVQGWKVIILPNSRDEAMLKFDLTKSTAYVKCIRVVRKHEGGNTLLGEISEFLE